MPGKGSPREKTRQHEVGAITKKENFQKAEVARVVDYMEKMGFHCHT